MALKFKSVDIPGLLALVLVLASASALSVPSSTWRLQIEGAEESDGELVLAVTPDGGSAEEIVVAIGRADGENELAHKTLVALQVAVGTDYAIEQDDGED